MKKNKISAFALAALTVSSLWLGSCKDDFSEEDLINAQQERADELSAENIAVINASNVTYRVNLHSNQEPQVGVSVSVTDQSTGELSSSTTDESGNAIFADINLGAKLVQVVSESHADMSWVVDFGEPEEGRHYQILNGNAFALEVAEFSKVEMIQTEGMQTATITGVVTIETDLTNTTPEIPQDLVLRANLDGFVASSHSTSGSFGSSIYVGQSLTFTEGDIASASVDNQTGEYTLQVPASDDGNAIEMVLPLVEADQTLAHEYLNGVEVGPQISTVPARFGPGVVAKETPIVDGTIAVFPEPAAPGRGVIFDFVAPPTGIFGDDPVPGGIFILEDGALNGTSGILNTSKGEGYQSAPGITVSGPDLTDEQGGIQAELIPVSMRWELPSFNITAGGDDYAEDALFVYQIRAFDEDDNLVLLHPDVLLTDPNVFVFSEGDAIASDSDGSLDEGIYDVEIVTNGFESNVVYTTGSVARFEVTVPGTIGTEPTIVLTYGGTVEIIGIPEEGDGYIDNPTITFEGGNPTTPASLELKAEKHWILQVDNSAVTQSYLVPPNRSEAVVNFTVDYVNTIDGETNDGPVMPVEIDENGFIIDENLAELLDQLETENGDVVLPEPEDNFNSWASFFTSFEKPRLLFVEPEHERATADVTVEDGAITDISITNGGVGYPAPFDLEIVSLTGSGVDFALDIDGNAEDGYFAVQVLLVNGGSGYLGADESVNVEAIPATQDVSLDLKNGQTLIQNINYGTGATIDDVLPPAGNNF